jgi:hypothetical protein
MLESIGQSLSLHHLRQCLTPIGALTTELVPGILTPTALTPFFFCYESAQIVAEPVKPLLRGCKGLIAPCLMVRGRRPPRCRGRPPSALPLVWQVKQLFQAREKFGLTHNKQELFERQRRSCHSASLLQKRKDEYQLFISVALATAAARVLTSSFSKIAFR